MTTTPHFIHLWPSGDRCSLAGARRPAFSRQPEWVPDWRCPGCKDPKPDGGPIDVVIEESDPGPSPLSFAIGVGLIRRHFLELLLVAQEVMSELRLGTVHSESRGLLPDWCTYNPALVIVRGTTNVTLRHCALCKRPMYFSMGKKYLHSPSKPGRVFTTGNSIVLREDVVNLGFLKKMKGFYFERLPVTDSPADGLGSLS